MNKIISSFVAMLLAHGCAYAQVDSLQQHINQQV